MLRSIFLGLLVIAISACSTIKVKSDKSSQHNFSNLKSFAWLDGTNTPSEDVRINNKIVIDSVRTAVEKNLSTKGFSKTEVEKADFLITWFGAIEKKVKTQNIQHFYSTYGYGTLYHNAAKKGDAPGTEVTEYEEGSLIFDFFDPRDSSLLWRAVGRDKVGKGKTETEVRQNINRAVRHILRDFPPN